MKLQSIFQKGFRGKADTLFAGTPGSVFEVVGVDGRSVPGTLRAQQQLKKTSGSTVDVLATDVVSLDKDKRVWFGENKAFLDDDNNFTQKLALSRLDRDIMFSTPSYRSLATVGSTVRLSEDGLKLYLFSVPTSRLEQYTLAQAYDVSTAGKYDYRNTFTNAVSFWVAKNKLFILTRRTIAVYKITGWDFNTQHAKIAEWDISNETTTAQDIYFREDGLVFWVQQADGKILEYQLSAPYGGEWHGLRILVVGGGGGGADVGSSGSRVRYAGGAGGGGGAYEWFGQSFLVGTTREIEIGAGGLRGSIGNDGGRTSFADYHRILGGGGGGPANWDYPPYEQNQGRDGGNGGNGGVAWDEQSSASGDRAVGPGGKALYGGTVEFSGFDGLPASSGTSARAGIGTRLRSDISGVPYIYSLPAEQTPANSVGANGLTFGQGGGGGSSRNSGAARRGGNGYQGVAIVRFKTSDITFTQTNGTVTTKDDETIITWTVNGQFTVTADNSPHPQYQATYTNLPKANAFAVEVGRILLATKQGVEQYTMTDYDFSTALLHGNTLFIPSEMVLGGLFLHEDYLFVGLETGLETNLPNVGRFEFIESEVNILSAHLFSVPIEKKIEQALKYDSVGLTTIRHPSSFGVERSRNRQTLTGFTTTRDLTHGRGGFPTNESTAWVLLSSSDPSYDVRAGVVEKTETSLEVDLDLLSAEPPYYNYTYFTVKQDAPAFFSVNTNKYRQPLIFLADTALDRIEVKLREGRGLDGGYDLRMRIIDVTDETQEEIIVDKTQTVKAGDISTNETMYPFEFALTTLQSGLKYVLELELLDIANLLGNTINGRYLVAPGAACPAERGIVFSPYGNTQLELQLRMFNTTTEKSEGKEEEERIYFTTEKMLFYIKAEDVDGDWAGKVVSVGSFARGHKEHHPTAVQNLSLFIGDGSAMAEVMPNGVFVRESDFNVEQGEVIQTLAPFDTDLLVGTAIKNYGRVLRWDTRSESWTAQDEVFEEGGVRACLPDDNYIYIFAGKRGVLYFYNGEKNILTERIAGVPSGELQVRRKAVGFVNNMPLFGVSNVKDNPMLQGVYGIGKYAPQYPVSISLDFPVPTDEMAGVEIGAIASAGNTFYVSWQGATETGIATLDFTQKYKKAYIETRVLSNAGIRHQLKTLSDVMVPYFDLPEKTGVTIGLKKAYENNFTNKDVEVVPNRSLVQLKSPHTVDIANPQLRIGFTVNGNDSPVIEDVLWSIASVGNK